MLGMCPFKAPLGHVILRGAVAGKERRGSIFLVIYKEKGVAT